MEHFTVQKHKTQWNHKTKLNQMCCFWKKIKKNFYFCYISDTPLTRIPKVVCKWLFRVLSIFYFYFLKMVIFNAVNSLYFRTDGFSAGLNVIKHCCIVCHHLRALTWSTNNTYWITPSRKTDSMSFCSLHVRVEQRVHILTGAWKSVLSWGN